MACVTDILDILTDADPIGRIEYERSHRDTRFSFIGELMEGCEHPHFHKEGDVWEHTKLVVRNMVKQPLHDYIDVAVALLHDVGKKAALEANHGKNMVGHELYGARLSSYILASWDFPENMRDAVIYLVQNHMRAGELVKCKSKYSAWLLVSDPLFYRMRRIAVADSAGTLGDDGKSICDWEEEFAKSLAGTLVDEPMPRPIVTFPDLCGLVNPYFLYDALGLAYKLQINGNTDNRSSIVKCVVNTYKKKKIPQ
jgi:hypothetical protein